MSGVVHGDELRYLFNLKLENSTPIQKGDRDFQFSDKMVKLWTSFAETGYVDFVAMRMFILRKYIIQLIYYMSYRKPMEMTEKAGAEWSPVPSGTGKHGVEWYKLDSQGFSRPIIHDGLLQSTFWDEVDLGGYKTLPSSSASKFAIGYEMANNGSKPSPISIMSPTSASSTVKIAFNSTPKPGSSQSTRTTLKPLEQNPFEGGGGVLKDDDPYSSTTTSTTKKPSFFQKLVG